MYLVDFHFFFVTWTIEVELKIGVGVLDTMKLGDFPYLHVQVVQNAMNHEKMFSMP